MDETADSQDLCDNGAAESVGLLLYKLDETDVMPVDPGTLAPGYPGRSGNAVLTPVPKPAPIVFYEERRMLPRGPGFIIGVCYYTWDCVVSWIEYMGTVHHTTTRTLPEFFLSIMTVVTIVTIIGQYPVGILGLVRSLMDLGQWQKQGDEALLRGGWIGLLLSLSPFLVACACGAAVNRLKSPSEEMLILAVSLTVPALLAFALNAALIRLMRTSETP